MSRPTIAGFAFDEDNETKLVGHGLTLRQVGQVLDGPHVVVRNRRRRRARYLVIGRDHGGACIAVPVERTAHPGIWRPVTAWRCKESERRLLEIGGTEN